MLLFAFLTVLNLGSLRNHIHTVIAHKAAQECVYTHYMVMVVA